MKFLVTKQIGQHIFRALFPQIYLFTCIYQSVYVSCVIIFQLLQMHPIQQLELDSFLLSLTLLLNFWALHKTYSLE